MTKSIRFSLIYYTLLLSLLFSLLTCSQKQLTVKEVVDSIVTRLYESMNEEELSRLNDEMIMNFISQEEKYVLATKYWSFDVNVPVVVSIMRHQDQRVTPFWLTSEGGFIKTDMIVKNEEYTYEVWQKRFESGRVELGINGFDKHRPHYFVSVGPQNPKEQLQFENFFPENQNVSVMDIGATIYHDWDELVLIQIPEALQGQKLLTTIRGRAREAHLINAFRKTPFPSSEMPDQVMLTWSGDPRNTQSIQWRTNTKITEGVVRFWEKSSNAKQDYIEITAEYIVLEDRLLQNDRYIHRFTAQLDQLKPATTYIYKVGSPAKNLWSQEAEFRTAPDGPKPFKFVSFGDTHRSPHWGKLINAAFERFPETAFYTIAGDIVSTGLYRDDWDHLFTYSANVIKNRPLMPSLGNHDDQDGLGAWMYFDLFALQQNGPSSLEPERAYSFEYSNALLVVLDVTSSKKDQVNWLENQLSQSDATWKFAVFHFPPYMYESEYKDIRQLWGDVFDKYHLDMALSGHIHVYSRSKPMYNKKPVASPADGTIYIISIGIPNRGNEFPDEEYSEVFIGGEMLYQTFDIDGNRLVYQVHNIDGDVRDELVIEK